MAASSILGAFERALTRARLGFALANLALAIGCGAGAALAVAALARASGRPAASLDVAAAAACVAAAAFGLARRRARERTAAGKLDAILGSQAFGAAAAGGGSTLSVLTAREALRTLGPRDPARLLLRDWSVALAAPAAGAALLLTAPLAARALGTDGAGRRAARAGEIETIRASATRVLTAARSDAEREAAREVLALADRASLALTPAEAAALDGELERAARGLGAAGDAGAGDGPSPLARGDGAPPADAGGGGERAAGGERSEGPPGASGGAPRDAGAPGAVTLPGPSDPARSSAVALAPAWPSRFDAVVRLYFEGAASRRQPELPATNPQVKR